MKHLGLLLVLVLVAGQVPARRINENDSPPEPSGELRKVFDNTATATGQAIPETVRLAAGELRSRQDLIRASQNEKFRNFLERLRNTIREGNETLGVPQLDPFEKDSFETDFENKFIKGSVKLENFEVLGLAGYRVDKAEIALLARTLSVGLTWPSLYSSGSYKFNAVALNGIRAYGEGEYTATVTDLSFETKVFIRVSPMSIKKMETKVSLGGLALSITGLFDDEYVSAILSEVLSDVVPQLVRDHQHEITTEINAKVMEFGNKKLEGMTLSELLALLN